MILVSVNIEWITLPYSTWYIQHATEKVFNLFSTNVVMILVSVYNDKGKIMLQYFTKLVHRVSNQISDTCIAHTRDLEAWS